MVSRASAVGCHPLREVPSCEGGGRLADPLAVPDDPLTEAIHYARLCRIWYSRARPCTRIEVRGAEVRQARWREDPGALGDSLAREGRLDERQGLGNDHAACEPISRPAPSPFFSLMWRARRSSCTSSVRRLTQRSSPITAAPSARPARLRMASK